MREGFQIDVAGFTCFTRVMQLQKFKLYQHDATDSCDSGWLYCSEAPLRVLEVRFQLGARFAKNVLPWWYCKAPVSAG